MFDKHEYTQDQRDALNGLLLQNVGINFPGMLDYVRDLIVVDAAAREMVATTYEAIGDNAERFSCTEITNILEVFEALGTDTSELLDMHAEGDDEGDDHWRPTDGKTLIAGILYDDETGEEADPQ